MFTALICSLIAMACAAGNSNGPSSEDRSRARNVGGSTDTIEVARDAYLGPHGDDYWKGTTDSLVVDGVRSTRILIQADQAAILAAIGSGTLAGATLELTVQTAGATWPASGATVDAHRVLQHWTEAEVTWVCADGHEGWDMSAGAGSIWQIAHTARTTITNGQTGVIRLDVTADVAAFLSGQANHGWLIKRTSEGASEPGRISFASREGTLQPRLIIHTASQPSAWPVLAGRLPAFDTSRVASVTTSDGSVETYFRTGAMLRFELGITDADKAAAMTRHGLTVLGATDASRRLVFVTFADQGPSYEALEAFLRNVQDDPDIGGVLPVLASGVGIITEGRYPSDGSGQQRADWIAGAASTRALRAIRAPLAWGCETGISGQTRVPVGVIEWTFDPLHPEYSGSLTRNWVFPDTIAGQVVLPQDSIDNVIDHSTSVLGVLSARGDNAQGTAGMLWGSQLSLYSLNNQWRQPLPLNSTFYLFVQEITADRPRILSLSADQPIPGATQALRDTSIAIVAQQFRELLGAVPDLLIVLAAGNEKISESLAVYRNRAAPKPTLLRTALLTLRGEPGYADRVVVVTGATAENTFAAQFPQATKGANFFTGATDIAAPAIDVPGLRRRTGSSVPVSLRSGTSWATPLVAGAAAQLLAMDPLLTPAQVKQYLLRGAQQPKPNPNTGITPPAGDSVNRRVQGAPGPVYLLDVYGSLTLLAREREGAPLCGAAVQVQGQSIVARYDGVPPRTLFTFPSGVTPFLVRGAQGGRLLAVSLGDQVQELRLSGTTWQPFGTQRPGVFYKEYLERDTVEYAYDANFLAQLRVTRRDGSAVNTAHFWQSQDPQGTIGLPEAGTTFAPSGEFATVSDEYRFLNGVGAQCLSQHRLYLFPLGGSSSTLVRNGALVDTCAPGPAWRVALCDPFRSAASPDGRLLAIAKARCSLQGELALIYETDVDLSPVSGTVVGTPVAALTATGAVQPQAFSADGFLLHSLEAGSGTCSFARRLVSSLQLVSTTSCDGTESPRPVNVMAARTLTSAQQRGKGAARVEGGAGPESKLAAHRARHQAWLKAMRPSSRVN